MSAAIVANVGSGYSANVVPAAWAAQMTNHVATAAGLGTVFHVSTATTNACFTHTEENVTGWTSSLVAFYQTAKPHMGTAGFVNS